MAKKKRRKKKKGGAGPFLLILLLGGAAGAGYFLKDCAFGMGTGTGDGEGEGEGQAETTETTPPNTLKSDENTLGVTVEGVNVKKGDAESTVDAICAELVGKAEDFTLVIDDKGGQEKVLQDLEACAKANNVKTSRKTNE